MTEPISGGHAPVAGHVAGGAVVRHLLTGLPSLAAVLVVVVVVAVLPRAVRLGQGVRPGEDRVKIFYNFRKIFSLSVLLTTTGF